MNSQFRVCDVYARVVKDKPYITGESKECLVCAHVHTNGLKIHGLFDDPGVVPESWRRRRNRLEEKS